MDKMCPSWEALKPGSLGVPESASAGHSNPLTVLHTERGPKYGSISREHILLFLERPWRWVGNDTFAVLTPDGESFSCCLWQRALPSAMEPGAAQSGCICFCVVSSVFFLKAYCALVSTNQFLWMTPWSTWQHRDVFGNCAIVTLENTLEIK